jgi:hypothetical protein
LWTTLGKRYSIRRKLAKLATMVRIEYLESVLGPSAFRRSMGDGYTEDLFVLGPASVQTISDSDGTVATVAITVTHPHFRPHFSIGLPGSYPSQQVVLGRTRFGDLILTRQSLRAFRGARRFRFEETYYVGNPGGYQTYVLAHTNSGAGVAGDFGTILTGNSERREKRAFEPPQPDPALDRFRANTVVNTFAVTAPNLAPGGLDSLELGAEMDMVRLLPMSWWQRWRANRRLRHFKRGRALGS